MFSSAQPDLLPSMSQYTLLRGPPPRQQRRHRPALTVNRDPFPPRPAPPRPRLAHTTAASLFAFFFVVVGWVALEGCGGVGRFLLFFFILFLSFSCPTEFGISQTPHSGTCRRGSPSASCAWTPATLPGSRLRQGAGHPHVRRAGVFISRTSSTTCSTGKKKFKEVFFF